MGLNCSASEALSHPQRGFQQHATFNPAYRLIGEVIETTVGLLTVIHQLKSVVFKNSGGLGSTPKSSPAARVHFDLVASQA
jgi:hypothetical protein